MDAPFSRIYFSTSFANGPDTRRTNWPLSAAKDKRLTANLKAGRSAAAAGLAPVGARRGDRAVFIDHQLPRMAREIVLGASALGAVVVPSAHVVEAR